MGVVYRGRDETLERDVALKVMALDAADTEARARFQKEGIAAARLQHPNIVTIYELGEHEGQPFMALELLEGTDLQRAIEAGLRPDPKATLPRIIQVLAGLAHAHENGIVHRDVKPSNVFLPWGRPAKIMDFGVARLTGTTTTAGLVVGTPNYMSPEQPRGGELDGRSDLFSVGLILYALVTGEKAFKGDTVVSLLFKIVHEEPDLGLIPYGPGWDRLRRVITRAVAKSPSERFPDASSMAAELIQAWQDLGGSGDWQSLSDSGVRARVDVRRPAAPVAETPLAPSVASDADLAETKLLRDAAAGTSVAPATRVAAPGRGSALKMAGALTAAAVLVLAAAYFVFVGRRAPSGSDVAGLQPTPAASAPASPRPAAPSAPPSVPVAPPAGASTGSRAPLPSPSTPRPTARPSTRAADAQRPPTAVPTSTPTPAPPPVRANREKAPAPPPSADAPASAVHEDREDASLVRANDLFDHGRYGPALQEAKAVLRREPRNVKARELVEDAEVELVAEECLKNARDDMKKGERDDALAEVKRGLAAKPADGRLL